MNWSSLQGDEYIKIHLVVYLFCMGLKFFMVEDERQRWNKLENLDVQSLLLVIEHLWWVFCQL